MMPAPMKPSLAGVGEVSAAMMATERVERTWGRTVVEDRLRGSRNQMSAGAESICQTKFAKRINDDVAKERSRGRHRARHAAHLLSDVDGVRVETAVGRRHVCANIEK
jgi:hypothetical protein